MVSWVSTVLQDTAHRPWPITERPWIMLQRWEDLFFAHWPVPVGAVRDLIPPELEIDTWHGEAWVGVVPFRLTVRPRFTPILPGISVFPELNVRTYVKQGDQTGVWFFSLDATGRLAIELARMWFKLPYFRAEMSIITGDQLRFESERSDRRGESAQFSMKAQACGDVEFSRPGTLEHWLTERYSLYTAEHRGRLYKAEVHHVPWPLQPAEAEFVTNTMTVPLGFELPDTCPLLHYARQLDVVVWNLQRVGYND